MIQQKVYVVEDMAVARAALIHTLCDNNFLVLGSAANAEKAWDEINQLEIDIILLDINLTGNKDGLWLAKKIRTEYDMPIVFLSAYADPETLKRLIDLKPNGYLMKPYNDPTLLTTIIIALKSFQKIKKISKVFTPYIFIKNSGILIKLDSNEIQYIKSDGNYLDIFLQETKYTIREKLQSFLESLPIDTINQTHQRYAVNFNHIETISNNKVVVLSTNIPISKSYKDSFMDLFNKNNL